MGILLRVLSGLATGAGNYLVEKGKLDMQAARDDLLLRRELALKDLEHTYRKAEMQEGGKITRENTSHAAKEQRVTNKAEGEIRGTLQDDAQSHALTLESLQHRNQMTREQQDDFRTFSEEAKRAGTYIDRQEVMADGRMVVWTKDGKSKIIGAPGSFIPAGRGSDSEGGGDSVNQYRPREGVEQKTAAAPTPEPKNFAARYREATPETAPRLFRDGKKIPMNEAMRLYQGVK